MYKSINMKKFSVNMKKFSVLLMICCTMCAMAAPVRNLPVMRIQPKGDTLHCFVTGDEFFHRLHDAQDYTIVQNVETGWYVYAAEEAGLLVPTQWVPGRDDPARAGLRPGLKPCSEQLRKMRDAWKIPAQYQRPEPKTSGRNHGQLNNIVIFIRFSDESTCTTDPFNSIADKFNDSTIGASSLYNYFKVDSYNKLHVLTHFYPAPVGTAVMSFQDTYARGYYEPYSATNTIGYNGDSQRTTREFDLLERAVNWINSFSPIPASLNLDIDNDGTVDNICFVVSGTNNGWNDLLWPHKWSLYDRTVNINGKRVWTFNLQLAGAGDHYFGVSTLCHEMTHTLGAPDLYHYDYYTEISPAGSWDLMHSNATPPQQTNSLFKYKYLNWFDSIPQLTDSGTYTMQSLATGPNRAYKIASSNPHQWYILEYRNYTDTFDSSIPNRGMLIWRYNDLQTADNASFNNSDTPHELWLFRPGSTDDITNGTVSAAAFGVNGRSSFTPTSNPHPYLCNGVADTSFSITNIVVSSDNRSVSFTFNPRGGSACPPVTSFPYAEGFETGDIGCWSFASADPSNDGRVGVFSSADMSPASPHGGSYAFRFSSYSSASDYNQYLISPRLQSAEPLQFTFYYRRSNNVTENFRVRYSTSTNAASAFSHVLATQAVSTSGWQQCSVTVPANAHYVAINYYSDCQYYLYIDDISLVEQAVHDTTYLYVHDTLTRTLYDTLYTDATDTLYYTVVDTLPRIIHDTVIVAHSYAEMMAVSNNMSQGIAVGSGTFPVGTEVEIAALAKPGFDFDRWQDGNTDNPRRVTLTNNQMVSAYFSAVDNPAAPPSGTKTLVHDTIVVRDTTWITVRDTIRLTRRDTLWLPRGQHDTMWVDTHVPFDYDTLTYYTLTVSTDGMVQNPGWTSGSGRYPIGTVVEIGAMLGSEYWNEESGVWFEGWFDDTENLSDAVVTNRYGTAKVTMCADTYVTAYFSNHDGIDQPQIHSMFKIYTQDGVLVVESEAMNRVAVYNVMGQQVFADNAQRAEVSSLPAGVYLVRVGNAPARKVVIIR